MTDHSPILRMINPEKLRTVLTAHNAWWLLLGSVPITTVRDRAARYRDGDLQGDNDTNGPALAAALDRLAETTEASPVDEWDRPQPTPEHANLFRITAGNARDRSPLLESFADDLTTLWAAKDPGVAHARRALAVLADANLLMPGLDIALRPVLNVYAAMPATQPAKNG